MAGVVERVTFHNPDNGFSVLRVKARGQRGIVTVVGHAAAVTPGEWVTATGEWVHDRTHGPQFRARFLAASEPTSHDGIRRYLGSGLIRGIGPVYAKKLVAAFGDGIFDVIEASPERLREVDGIGSVRAERIRGAWAEQRMVREIMIFLHGHGVGTARAVRIFKTYGADAVEVMSTNPYQLSRDIRGIGFKTADALAMRLGIERTAPIRLRAGVSHALAEAMDDGHCGLPRAELVPAAAGLLEAPENLVEAAMEAERAAGALVADRVGETPCVFLAGLHQAERAVAARVRAIAAARLPWPAVDAERAIPWIERRIGLALAPSQVEAVRLALSSKVLVVTGGPGVGKTTLVNAVLGILAARRITIALCAPTGRAARRLRETTGLDARTIHRLLEVDPASGGFRRGPENPLECDLLVVDEMSMVDVPLMHALAGAVPDRAAVLLVGDIDQLPSVGPGQVLADLIESGAVPVVRLTEVFRQAARSRIIVNAHRVNEGELPDLRRPDGPDSDFYFVPVNDPAAAAERIQELVEIRIPRRFGTRPGPRRAGALPDEPGRGRRPRAEPGPAGGAEPGRRAPRRALRLDVRARRQGDADSRTTTTRRSTTATSAASTTSTPSSASCCARFDDRAVSYGFGELDALVPAYATTIHKSQGSEVPRGRPPAPHRALHHAAAEPALHRPDPRAPARGTGRAAEGGGHRGPDGVRAPALVEAAGVARAGPADCLSPPVDTTSRLRPLVVSADRGGDGNEIGWESVQAL